MKHNRCAILCSGLSVREHDLSKITDPIIGVNWSYLGRQPDIYVVSNKVLIKESAGKLDFVAPRAYARFAWLPIRGAFTPDITMYYSTMKPIERGWPAPPIPANYNIYRDGWVFAGGGPCALQVAVSMGFDDIVFVGLDLCHEDDFHFYSHEGKRGLDKSEYSGYTGKMLEDAWTVQLSYFDQVLPGQARNRTASGARVRNTGKADICERVRFEEVWG